MKQFAILSLLFILALAKDIQVGSGDSSSKDYHIRRIYYSEHQNVCKGDQQLTRRDALKIDIELPDKKISGVAVTLTSCRTWVMRSWGSITVLSSVIFEWNWRKHDEHDEITFKQETHETSIGPVGLGLTVKTSVQSDSPAIIQGIPYDCVVQGDDTVYHFGYYEDIQPPTVKVSCQKKLNFIKE